MSERPLPPYSFGHEAQIQPPAWSFFTHCGVERLAFSGVHGESLLTPTLGQVLLEPGTDLGTETSASGG